MKKGKRINKCMKRSIFSLFVLFILALQMHGISFVVLGDSRNGEETSPIFKTIMREINLLSPDFVIHTGDWVGYPSRKGWENFLKVIKIGGVPFYLTVGNHETAEDWKSLYKEMINKPFYYSFKYENCYFIILNPYIEVPGKIDEKQFKWLEKELMKAKKSDFIFVFIHEPLYPIDGHIDSSLDRFPQERDKLANLLRRYKDKIIVFCGHEHLYNKSVIDGLTQIISGGAGAPLYTADEKGGFYHYLYVTVKGKLLQIAVIKPGSILTSDLLQND